jgi:hypothetical protein
MFVHIVESFRVTCALEDQQLRVWRCGCSEFERRHRQLGEGFCVHTALAIERTIKDGHTMPGQRLPAGEDGKDSIFEVLNLQL